MTGEEMKHSQGVAGSVSTSDRCVADLTPRCGCVPRGRKGEA